MGFPISQLVYENNGTHQIIFTSIRLIIKLCSTNGFPSSSLTKVIRVISSIQRETFSKKNSLDYFTNPGAKVLTILKITPPESYFLLTRESFNKTDKNTY